MGHRRHVTVLAVLAALLLASGTGTATAREPMPARPDSGPVATPRLGIAQARAAALRGDPRPVRPSAAGRVTPAATSNGSSYTPLTPVRVLDTRTGAGVPVGPAGAVTVDLSAWVPASVTAVVLNVTGIQPSLSTFITVWPSDAPRPTASNLNLAAGQIRPNAVTVALSPDRAVNLFNNRGTVHLAVDLAGYYAAGLGSKFTTLAAPQRVLDTRSGAAVGPGGTITLDLSGTVPPSAQASAVTFNLTGVGATASTFVTAWPAGAARPVASSLNLVPGQITPNQVTVSLGVDRRVNLYNHNGSTHLVADLAGFYATDRGAPFYQLAPLRLFDTREGFGKIPADSYLSIPLEGFLPSAADTLVFNLTGTNPTASTFETAWPDGAPLPTASNLNLVPGQTAANLTTAGLGPAPERRLNVYNRNGSVDLILDLAGYFGPAPPPCTANCMHTWGDNLYGQLAVGTTGGGSNTPGQVSGLSGVAAVTAGALNGYALLEDGAVMSWGLNDLQGLGNGRFFGMSTVPTRVQTPQPVQEITSGAYAAYALGSGDVWAWGYNGDGGLGDGTTQARDLPVEVSGLGSGVIAVAAGFTTGYALKENGTVWAWGSNGGSLGNGQFGSGCEMSPVGPGCRETTPIPVPGLSDVVSIAATWNNAFALERDGTVWAWGWNAEGQLGLGTAGGAACYESFPPTAPNCVALSPVPVPALSGVKRIVGGGISTAYALTTDGTVLAWGANRWGELGNGTTGGPECSVNPSGPACFSATPVPVSELTEVGDVVGGGFFALALRNDGTVWSWGDNRFGQLGAPAPANVPVQVAGLSGVTRLGAGGFVGLAVVPVVAGS